MLHHLLCSRSHVSRVLDLFAADRELGLVFPVYHTALREQIGWGTNFPSCLALAAKLGMEVEQGHCAPFPAGSFFFARTDAVQPLFSVALDFKDFPQEKGQVDGTLAHAVERMLSTIVLRRGYRLRQIASTRPHSLSTAYFDEHRYHSPLLEAIKAGETVSPPAFRVRAWPEARVCLFSCVTNGYDRPLMNESLVHGADYVFFSDTSVPCSEPWKLRRTNYWNRDPVRVARFYKSNPGKFLNNYDIAVWVDANIAITGDITKHIDRVIQENACFGAVRHPFRANAYEEAEQLIRMKKDIPELIRQQMASYRADGFPATVPLCETGFLVMDLQRRETKAALDLWWSEINRHSRRDQLSFEYACWKTGAKCVSLFDEGGSVRSNPDFAYFAHGAGAYPYVDVSSKPGRSEQPRCVSAPRSQVEAVQIVVCVHNALEEVRACLASVAKHTDKRHRVLIIDDNSGEETATFVKSFAATKPNFEVRTLSGGPWGYCRAANEGLLRTDYGSAVLLLNSDTVVESGWTERLIRTANTIADFGAVGPMSNAASSQSLPAVKSRPDQTAINEWPADVSVSELNRLCNEWAGDLDAPVVPLVHGFCQLISRRAVKATAGFDETAFPQGYGEENDFCFRSEDAGFRHQIDLRTFVHHEKSKSYTDSGRRQQLMTAGMAALKRRHGEHRVVNAITTMEQHPVLIMMRARASEYLQSIRSVPVLEPVA